TYRQELLRKIENAVPAVREEAQNYLTEYEADFNRFRYGHITVPEPAVVESVSVGKGQEVSVGTPIAVVRPIFKYTMEARFDSSAIGAQVLLPGAIVTWALSCDGAIATTRRQKTLILRSAEKNKIIEWLTQVKARHLETALYRGRVEYVGPSPKQA